MKEAFWDQVQRGAPDECWLWTGKKIRGGYGDFRPNGVRHVIAHRWSWFKANGPIPDGLFVLHRCDTPACVNPAHLFLGNQQDNMDDQAAKGRRPDARGDANKHARLTVEAVLEIRRLVNEEHRSRSSVAAQFGLHRKHVTRIANGLAWASVPMRSAPWAGRARPGRPRKMRDLSGLPAPA